jgi:hypothetical protein
MIAILAAAVTALAALTLLNLMLVLAVVRRLRQQATAPAGQPELPAVGTRVGRFRTTSVDGLGLDELALSGARTLVAFVSPGCSPCGALADTLVSEPAGDVSWLLFVTGSDDDEATAAMATRLAAVGQVAVVTESGPESAAFGGVSGFPTVLRIERGVIAAAGFRLSDVLPESLVGVR